MGVPASYGRYHTNGRFRVHGKDYGIYREGGISFADDPSQVSLADLKLRARERFIYEYDMGDSWLHPTF